MTKIDQLIDKFKEFKEELNKATCPYTHKDAKLCPKDCPCKKDMKKNVNMSYSSGTNSATGMPSRMGTSGGQGGMYRSEDMEKQMASASPGGAQDMHMIKYDKNGQWRLDGKNREASPKLRQSDLGPGGKVHMIRKDEGTNEEANPTKPHNKGKFKVMSMTSEKEEKHASPNGLPYSGKDKDVKKGEHQGNNARGFDENKAPGRGTLGV